MATWIQTWSGARLDPFNLDPKEFNIADVAHSLSNICRFNGHVNYHYSVAQHSVHVADITLHNTGSKRKAFIALNHEIAEYTLHDICRPLKKRLPDYVALEEKLTVQLYDCIKVPEQELEKVWPEVRIADNLALCREAKDLFSFPPIDGWTDHYKTDWIDPYKELKQMQPKEAELLFLQKFSLFSCY